MNADQLCQEFNLDKNTTMSMLNGTIEQMKSGGMLVEWFNADKERQSEIIAECLTAWVKKTEQFHDQYFACEDSRKAAIDHIIRLF